MKAVIIANGNIINYNFFSKILYQADCIICVDGGANHLRKMNIFPHVIIGDLDSIKPRNKSFFKQNNIKIIRHPPQKDSSDTELAIKYAMDKKYNDLTLIGVTGTRLDHTLANIFLVTKLSKKIIDQKSDPKTHQKIKCRIIDDHNEIFIVTDKLTLEKKENSFVSLLSLSDKVEGVTISGLKYPLNNAIIESGSSLGISNEFTDKKAIISIKKGTMIVIISRD